MNPILEKGRVRTGMFASSESDGFNGFFIVRINHEDLRIIASDGMGWQHVSVSKMNSERVPNWSLMCAVKDLCWGDDDWVVQFHPAKTAYVNNHPGCLHLWRPTREKMPMPPHELTGMKDKSPEQISQMSHAERLAIYVKANLK